MSEWRARASGELVRAGAMQEVASSAANVHIIHWDHKGRRAHSLLFYLQSPEETPLLL